MSKHGKNNPNFKHGKSKSSERVSWKHMMQRCYNPKCKSFSNYGGRGIKVCNRWKKFINFYADMGDKPSKKHTIERLDVNKGYNKSNCIWATTKEQNYNKRTSRVFCVNGSRKTLPEIAFENGITYGCLKSRMNQMGLTLEEALKYKRRCKITAPRQRKAWRNFVNEHKFEVE